MLTLDEYKPESHVVETQATIIQKWESGISRGTAYHIRYRFTGGDLKTYEAETSVNRELYDVVLSGSKIAVAYVAENPKNSRIKSRKGELEDSSSGTVIVLIVIGLAVMGLILITSAKSLRDQMNRYSFPK